MAAVTEVEEPDVVAAVAGENDDRVGRVAGLPGQRGRVARAAGFDRPDCAGAAEGRLDAGNASIRDLRGLAVDNKSYSHRHEHATRPK